MADRWVLNASPVITLAKVEHTWLLDQLAQDWFMPAQAADEVLAGPAEDAGHRFVAGLPPERIRSVVPVPVLAAWDLGPGETAVLAWAAGHPGYTAMLDDRAARACALGLRIPVIGTIGVLVMARLHGHLPRLKPVLDLIRVAGLYVDDRLLARALRLAGE